MTARLLRMVNSAYFGLATDIDTVNRAVSLLGTQEVHDLVLAVSVALEPLTAKVATEPTGSAGAAVVTRPTLQASSATLALAAVAS